MVPVIGNDLSIIRFNKKNIDTPGKYKYLMSAGVQVDGEIYINLYDYLAYCLRAIYVNEELPSPTSINNVFLHIPKDSASENELNNLIKSEILKLSDDQILLEPYRKLIRMGCFETFVTVNIDNFLERAFVMENKHFNKSRNFSIPTTAVDHNQKYDPALPRIFNLMGSIESYNFALSDEQWLEYVYMLHNENDTIAKELFEAINQKNILLIGSSFPDWFMRFFIRIISKERYKNGVKTKYVACDKTLHESDLMQFLENNAAKVIPIDKIDDLSTLSAVYKNSVKFINKMFSEYMKGNVVREHETHYVEKVFISYCREDVQVAERIKNEFDKNGVTVFFDEETLKAGDKYNLLIRNHIKDCNFFVALISENAIQEKNRYVYDKEWRSAIVLDSYKEKSYIRPYIIDDTSPADIRIPEEIRNINIVRILIPDEIPNTIRKFILENNLTLIKH